MQKSYRLTVMVLCAEKLPVFRELQQVVIIFHCPRWTITQKSKNCKSKTADLQTKEKNFNMKKQTPQNTVSTKIETSWKSMKAGLIFSLGLKIVNYI